MSFADPTAAYIRLRNLVDEVGPLIEELALTMDEALTLHNRLKEKLKEVSNVRSTLQEKMRGITENAKDISNTNDEWKEMVKDLNLDS